MAFGKKPFSLTVRNRGQIKNAHSRTISHESNRAE